MTMKHKNVRVGVAGAGIWGRMHVRAYVQHASAELVAICDLNQARAEEVATDYGIPQHFGNVDDLLDAELDAISVVTPDAAHADITIKAAERGVHVLVEKPLATTVDECERMISAASSHNVILMVDWHNRWNPPIYDAQRCIRNGEIGEVTYIYYRLSDTIYVPTKMLPWSGESTVLQFLGSHALDTTCWLIGHRPVRVTCRRKEGVLTGMGIPTADTYITMVDFSGGATAVVENCWILPQSSASLIDHKCEVIGSKGALYLDPTHGRTVAKYTPRTPGGFPDASFPDMFVTPQVHGRQLGFAVEPIYHFVECIRDGKKPLTRGEDGLLNTKLIVAAERSADVGEAVEIR
jgi:predicted dehydrogenase